MKHIFTSIKNFKSLILLAVALVAMTGNAWGGTAKYTVTANSSPSSGGYVMVSDNGSASFSGTATSSSKEKTGSTGWTGLSKQKFTLYVYASAKSGYTFKGWATSDNTNTTTSTSNPMSSSSSNLYYSQTDADTYYAIFAKLTTTKNSLSFGSKNTQNGWGNSQSVSVTYVHVGDLTAKITGTNATDFSFSNTSSSQSTTVVSKNTNTEASKSVTIYFNPQCDGARSATLTFSGNGLTKTVTLTGTGVLVDPSFSTTDGSVNVSVGSTTTINLSDRVTTNSDGTITYTCDNSAATISNGKFSATKAGEYTVNVSLAASCKYNGKTGSFKITVNRLPASLTTTDSEVNIYLAGMSPTTLDLSNLTTKVGNATVEYTITSSNKSFGTIANGKTFSATQAGDYTIHASMTQNDQYTEASSDFKVTVNKLIPTVEWKEYEHIYSGNTLNDVTAIKYNGNIVSGLGITLESKNPDVMTVEGNNLHAQILATQQDATIQATTEETTYYKSVTPTHTYTVEAKQTPIFKLNGKVLVAADTTIHLMIGETATMAFDKVDESQFTYPTTSGSASYTHNSTNHTGTITADYYGNREMVFEQKGTTTIFSQIHNVTIYVDKHPVTLSTTDALNNKTWLVDDVFEGDIYTVNAPATGEPAQKTVTVTSDNENVLKLVDGKWKAIGEGDATLTIAQESNDYWTGGSITKTIHVSKHTPVITWNAALNSNQPWAAVIDNPVSSTNTEVPFTVTSNDNSKADYVNGKIEVYNGNGEVTFTLTQEGNYKWNAATTNVTKTFTVSKPNNHVPFTLSSDNHSNFEKDATSYATWSSNGYRMCDGNINEREDYVILQFSGVPDKLTFDKSLEKKTVLFISELPGTHLCEVFESPNKKDWESAWLHNERVESTPNQSVTLQPSTRYLKFRYWGTVHANYKDIEVTERKEIKAPSEFDFTSGGIGDNPTTREISFKWYNVRTCTVSISGTDAKYFKLSDDSETIYSHLDEFNEDEKITVQYLHEEIKKHTATLTITSADGKSASITLKGETTKAAQEITWNPDLIVDGKLLIAKDVTYTDIATASSGLPVELYVADGETKLTVIDGETIKGLADGTTKLYAHQAGNDNKWADVTDNIDVQITSKTVQNIVWDDPLSNIKYTGTTKSVPLSARSSEDPTGTILPIKYTLDEAAQAFASINGSTLTISGTGTGTIKAEQAGNDTYVKVSATRTLTAYDPDASCPSNLVFGPSSDFEVKVTNAITTQEFRLDSEPATLSFTADIGSGSLTVSQYYDDTWHSLETFTGNGGDGNHSYTLNRNAKKISFQSTIVIAWPTNHKIKNLKVTKARYLEVAENYMDFSSVQKGQTVKRQFSVNYSDASGVFEVSLEKASEQFQLLSYTLGSGCGATTKQAAVIKVNCTGKTIGKETNKIIIKNKTNRLEIPLEAVVTGLTQQINWNFDETEEINTTDNIQLSATAGSGMPVTFSSGNESVAKVKKVGENYYLDIIKDGEVTITALQAGDDSWEEAKKECTFTISKVTPTISTQPTAEEVILPKQLMDCSLSGGEAKDGETVLHGTFTWDAPSTAIERNNTGYAVTFTPENDNWYTTANCTVQVPVLKTPQAITWTIPGETDGYKEIYCNASLTFDATAGSNLPVQYVSTDDEIAYVNESGKLIINRGGEVTITAKQEGDATYAAATPVEKTINILRVSPAIVEYPVADTMSIGTLLSNATIRGGIVKLGDEMVLGSFSWVNGDNIAMDEAGTFQKEILFTPTEAGWYEPITGENLNVVVKKYAPIITSMNLTAADITYGTVLSGVTGLTGTVVATDTVKKPNVIVQGTYAWASKTEFYDVNTETATVEFIPENDDWYDNLTFEVPLHVLPGHTTYSATATLDYGQTLADAIFTNTTKGLNNEDVAGSVQWAASVDLTSIPSAGTHTYAITFTPEEGSNYAGGEGTCTLVVEEVNLIEGDDISNTEERVVINTNITITDDVTVGGMTINPNFTVTIADGASLTIGNENSLYRATYGNIIVEAGGQLNLGTGTVELNDFTLHAAIGDDEHAAKSGQVSNEQLLQAHGHTYFVIDIDPREQADDEGWYFFTVPFQVNAMTGITRRDGNNWIGNMKFDVDYSIMTYHEELRAQGKYGWQKFKGIMQPGVAYLFGTNFTEDHYRFEMVEGGSFNSNHDQALQATTGGTDANKGWNGVGNGTMTYVTLTDAPLSRVQMYNHGTNSYDVISTDDNQFVVGSAYFVQAESNSTLTMASATDATRTLRAPARTPMYQTDATIAVSHVNSATEADQMYILADEDATSEYVIGKDLLKMGTMSQSRKTRIWTGMKPAGIMCSVYAPMQQNEATVPFGLYLPTAGTYTISARDSHAENVYLLRNGVIIWDLSMSDYNIELASGVNYDYSILLVAQGTNTATGVDNLNNNNENGTIFVEKMIVDGKLFLLRDGILYDATGKKVESTK